MHILTSCNQCFEWNVSWKVLEKSDFSVLENPGIWSLQVLESPGKKNLNVCTNPELNWTQTTASITVCKQLVVIFSKTNISLCYYQSPNFFK